MAAIELRGVEKRYPGAHAVRDLDLTVRDGELLVLLGPSGCGKSTILRLIAGLETVTAGEIRLGDRRIDGEPPQRRNVAMVFQSYALYGHMTVRGNLEFPLKMRGLGPEERARRVEEVAHLLEIEALMDARPPSLSGGQQQRVAMGRALVREPEAFLLDEPLSNLDARLRAHVRAQIARIQRRLGVTTLHVTHDQAEAMSLGDRVAVLREGRLQQIGSGQELYDRPANVFVASFLGQPGMNLVRGRMVRDEGESRLDIGPVSLRLPPELRSTAEIAAGSPLIVGVRPEALRLAPPSADRSETVAGRVLDVEALGSECILRVDAAVDTQLPEEVERALSSASGERASVLTVRSSPAERRLRVGESVALTIPPDALHLFDLEGRPLESGPTS
jgi:multiple sugar transport system ATP-binding protein